MLSFIVKVLLAFIDSTRVPSLLTSVSFLQEVSRVPLRAVVYYTLVVYTDYLTKESMFRIS